MPGLAAHGLTDSPPEPETIVITLLIFQGHKGMRLGEGEPHGLASELESLLALHMQWVEIQFLPHTSRVGRVRLAHSQETGRAPAAHLIAFSFIG